MDHRKSFECLPGAKPWAGPFKWIVITSSSAASEGGVSAPPFHARPVVHLDSHSLSMLELGSEPCCVPRPHTQLHFCTKKTHLVKPGCPFCSALW